MSTFYRQTTCKHGHINEGNLQDDEPRILLDSGKGSTSCFIEESVSIFAMTQSTRNRPGHPAADPGKPGNNAVHQRKYVAHNQSILFLFHGILTCRFFFPRTLSFVPTVANRKTKFTPLSLPHMGGFQHRP